MSVNSSSFFHAALNCFNTTFGILHIISFTVTSVVLLLPLYIFVLYLGFQQWRHQCSGTTMSHSDLFTFHMVFIELISVFGSCLCCWGVHADHPLVTIVAIYLWNVNLHGQTLFHILTCVERYLAVVHPVTYRSLKEARGTRMRNVIIGCVWLLCFANTALMSLAKQFHFKIISYVSAAVSLTVVPFCSLSVLCVLIRPGPGDGGGRRQQVDKSKLRAFYTIMVILGVLLFRFGGNTLTIILYDLTQPGMDVMCGMLISILWICMPSSLLLPLLFLQRRGKLLCCKSNNN